MEETQEYGIISKLPESKETPSNAIRKIIQLTQAAAASDASTRVDAFHDHFTQTLGSLMEIAAKTPPKQQKTLVEFILELQKHEVSDPATGQQIRHPGYHNARAWTDVPMLGITVADDWSFNPTNPSATLEEQQRFENQTAFVAQLLASPANSVPDPSEEAGPFDFSLYGLWAFREAFENTAEPLAPSRTALRGVCYWLIYSADRLWEQVENERSFVQRGHNKARVGKAKELQKKNWEGFNKDRWDRWVRGVQLSQEKESDEDTVALVEIALKEVRRVTDQSWRIQDEEKFA